MITPRQELSFARQLRVVLMSYLTRPGFRWSFVAAVSAAALVLLCDLGRSYDDARFTLFFDLNATLGSFVLIAGSLGLIIIPFWHARQQLMGTPARLMPHARTPNLIVAGTMLFALAALIATPSIFDPNSHFLGMFSVALLFVTLIAAAFCNPWLVPIPLVLWLIMSRHMEVYFSYIEIVQRLNLAGRVPPNKMWALLWEAYARENRDLRIIITLADILALILLEKIARPRKYVLRFSSILRFLPSRTSASQPVFDKARHQLVDSVFARSFHRRFAVHDWRAAGVAALGIALLSTWLGIEFGHDAPAVISMLLALLPGALVAIGWRDRWAILDFESLYPVSRRQFVTDMAAGLILDAAEFWIVSVLAALFACLCMRLPGLKDGRFWLALLIGGMLQFVWIAGVFFIGQRRSTGTFVVGLVPFALAVFVTVESVWRGDRPLSLSMTSLLAVIETGAGVAILWMTWKFLQRRTRTDVPTSIAISPAV